MEGDWDKMTRENEERFTCTGWGVFSGLRRRTWAAMYDAYFRNQWIREILY